MQFFRDFVTLAGRKGLAWLGTVTVMVAIGAFLASSDPALASVAVFAVLFVAAVSAAYVYWDRLRVATRRVDLAVALGTPRLVEPKPATNGVDCLLVIPSVRITNRSPDNQVSLGIRFVADVLGGYLELDEAQGRKSQELYSGQQPLLTTPLTIKPQDTEAGILVLGLDPDFVALFGADPQRGLEGKGEGKTNARLEIEDYVSDTSVTVPAPGSHP